MKFRSLILTISICLFFLGIFNNVRAQQTGEIIGTVVDQKDHQPLPGVNIWIKQIQKGTSSNQNGKFIFPSVPSGTLTLEFSFVGYKTQKKSVIVKSGETVQLDITLTANSIEMNGIQVTALRPDLKVDAKMNASAIQEANPRDSGELLRNMDGVNAVRRGPLGLDPVVRGLRETEVGTYINGTRIFPAGPARMDSPLSHFDPSTIQSISVVKGPYALTWGAGNMGAIRVETKQLENFKDPFGGQLASGYDSNFNALEESASVYGHNSKIGYWLHGAWRKGSDYKSGNGTIIPADFLSRELRGKIRYETSSNSYLQLALGYQNQENIDYPGRLLNADFFNTYSTSAKWEWTPKSEFIQSVNVSAYINNVDHGMENDGKPTAQPNPNRMPPFALDVDVDAHTHVWGGRADATFLSTNRWEWEAGIDFYSANREAIRTIRRKDNGMLMFTDLMWPDATITDAGLFTMASHSFSDRFSATATIRMDFSHADADTSSTFFQQNASNDLSHNETNVSSALTLSYDLSRHWTLGVGLGSVVRTADATERYSDRVPASKAQTSAEFMGNPALAPERNTQADLWLSASYPKWTFSLDAFARSMNDYITIEPTDLPKRLPLSPDTVYRYINGSAQFWGFEAKATRRLMEKIQIKGSLHYLWGKDRTLAEPALGVQPRGADLGLRYDDLSRTFFVEATTHFVHSQDRVASQRGEQPTDGYVTADLLAGLTLWNKLSIQLGVQNITKEQYVNHLNAYNPFTRQAIPEPGRVFSADLTFRF